jgi:hypothetical protein
MSFAAITQRLSYACATWKKAFALFDPKELSTLFLVSLKTTVRASKLMGVYFFWLLALCGYFDAFIGGSLIVGRLPHYFRPFMYSQGLAPRLYLICLLLVMFFTMLSVRASLEAKQARYYLGYLSMLPLFFVLFSVMPHYFLMPLFVLSGFFLLDSEGSLTSVVRSAANAFFAWLGYAPFMVSMGGAYGLLYNGYEWLWNSSFYGTRSPYLYVAKFVLSFVLFVFFVSLVGALYLKVKHSNQKLFWGSASARGRGRKAGKTASMAPDRPVKRPMKQRPRRRQNQMNG